ncbi:MAG: WecB/TagA/CpsF family glycosyltransferase [Patescibacteria group bacterium]
MGIDTDVQHQIFGIKIDDLSNETLEKRLLGWLKGNRPNAIFTPNPEFFLAARHHPEFAAVLNHADLSLPDGTGLRFAVAALTENSLVHRQTGIDTLVLLARLCTENKKTLLLLGGADNAAELAGNSLTHRFPELIVQAVNPGFVSSSISTELVSEINSMAPDVIAVALGAEKQERFILQLKEKIPSLKIAIGVGGAFDTLSGKKPRAPLWMRRMGLEWVWRVVIEPRRFKRIINATIIFPILVISDTLKHRRFLRALPRVLREIVKQFT